jgi:DNA polymerase III alpha subunit (gram-positive type)
MFEDTEMLSLYQAMDRMKKRYGFDAVARCRCHSKVKANNVHQLSLLSQPSLTIPLNELVQQAASCGVETMALTDINTVTGIYDFIKECKAVAIKPLVGIEFHTTINYFIA